MNFFDQWFSELQKTAKTLNDSTDWQPVEAMNELLTGKAKIAEKVLQKQTGYLTSCTDEFNQHCMNLTKKTDPVAIVEANYSFFCEQQVKANSFYLNVLDLAGEAKDLMDKQMSKAFVR